MMTCDGTGILEKVEEEGSYPIQLPCPGCEACGKPSDGQGGTEEVQVTGETLVDMLRAYHAVRGLPDANPMTSEVAWGMVITYLPALIEMSRQWMVLQEAEQVSVTVTAHKILDTGL